MSDVVARSDVAEYSEPHKPEGITFFLLGIECHLSPALFMVGQTFSDRFETFDLDNDGVLDEEEYAEYLRMRQAEDRRRTSKTGCVPRIRVLVLGVLMAVTIAASVFMATNVHLHK